MHSIYFSEKISSHLLDNLKQLFYFNREQKRYHSKIFVNVEKYGDPVIRQNNSHYTLSLPLKSGTENLFALDSLGEDGQILGCLVYILEGDSCIIVHAAIDELCTAKSDFKNEHIFYRLIERLKTNLLGKKIKYIQLPYTNYKISTNIPLLPKQRVL
jgi:hypothetical protein